MTVRNGLGTAQCVCVWGWGGGVGLVGPQTLMDHGSGEDEEHCLCPRGPLLVPVGYTELKKEEG